MTATSSEQRRLIGLGLALLSAVLALRPLRSFDTWWHLSMGEATWLTRARTFPDPTGPDPRVEYSNPEWLFDLFLYGLHALGGVSAVLWGAAALAGLFAALIWRSLQAWSLAPSTALCLSLVGIVAAHPHFVARPQSAFLCLLAGTLCLLPRDAPLGRAQGSLLIGVGVLWAQCHSSSILFPALVLPALWEHRRRALPWMALACLTPWTGSHGLGLIDQVIRHAGSDAALHIYDMSPAPTEAWWPPLALQSTGDLALPLLELLLLTGLLSLRRLPAERLMVPAAWALLGWALALTAVRFKAAACVLALPWAAQGLAQLPPLRAQAAWGLSALLTLGGASFLRWQAGGWGPHMEPEAQVTGAAEILKATSRGGLIFADYEDAGFLAWSLEDFRVWIDGRTPTHFDEEHYFGYRMAMTRPESFFRLHREQGFTAVLVPRQLPLCQALEEASWVPVWQDQEDTLFLAEGSPGLSHPGCAERSELLRSCEESSRWLESLEQSLALAPSSPYLMRLRAWLLVECGGEGSAAEAAEAVTLARELSGDAESQLHLEGWAHMRSGRALEALESLSQVRSLEAVVAQAQILTHLQWWPELEALVQDCSLAKGDRTPPILWVLGARAREAQGKLELAARWRARAEVLGVSP